MEPSVPIQIAASDLSQILVHVHVPCDFPIIYPKNLAMSQKFQTSREGYTTNYQESKSLCRLYADIEPTSIYLLLDCISLYSFDHPDQASSLPEEP